MFTTISCTSSEKIRSFIEVKIQDKKVQVITADASTELQIVLDDRRIRTLIINHVRAVRNEGLHWDLCITVFVQWCNRGGLQYEINLSNVSPTNFYLNFNNHSVKQLKRMLSEPAFSKKYQSSNISCKVELLTVEAIKLLGADYIQRPVLTHVSIMHVDEKQVWNIMVCTTCDSGVEKKEDLYYCESCERTVPYPETSLQIILHDRELRYLIGKRARQVIKAQRKSHSVSNSWHQNRIQSKSKLLNQTLCRRILYIGQPISVKVLK
ncbi:hypothetical protein ACET3Z_021581 [Daucus carota]